MQKNDDGPFLHTIQKKKKPLKIDLTIRAETKELLAENIGVNVHDLWLGNDFLDMVQKSKA